MREDCRPGPGGLPGGGAEAPVEAANTDGFVDRLAAARICLERVEALLARPRAAEAGQVLDELQRSTELLSEFERHWRHAGVSAHLPGLDRELERWRSELQRVTLLVLGASALCEGWVLAAGTPVGYSEQGQVQSVQPAQRAGECFG